MLGIGIVDGNYGELQDAVLGHTPEPNDAGGSFLGAPQHFADQLFPLRQDRRDQVGAVIHRDLGLVLQRGHYVAVVCLVVFALDRKNGNTILPDKGGRGVILSTERIRRAKTEPGPSVAQRDRQVRCFRGHMETSRNANSLHWLLLLKSFADQLQDGHRLLRPFDPVLPLACQSQVFHVVSHALPSLRTAVEWGIKALRPSGEFAPGPPSPT